MRRFTSKNLFVFLRFLLGYFAKKKKHQQHDLDPLGLSGRKVAQAASGRNKGWSVSRSFPCWLTLLAPTDNGNMKSEFNIMIFTPLLPCPVLFLNLSVWGFPALWVEEMGGGCFLRWWWWWSWWWPGSPLLAVYHCSPGCSELEHRADKEIVDPCARRQSHPCTASARQIKNVV